MGFKGSVMATLCVLGALASSGCQRGYQSARQLESAQRGPAHCAKSCTELGMRMSAFVLVESDVAGCVCEPLQPYSPPPSPGASPPGTPSPGAPPPGAPAQPSLGAPPPAEQPQSGSFRTSTGAAAGYVVLAMRRAAQQQQQQQQQQYSPPPAMRR